MFSRLTSRLTSYDFPRPEAFTGMDYVASAFTLFIINVFTKEISVAWLHYEDPFSVLATFAAGASASSSSLFGAAGASSSSSLSNLVFLPW